MESVLSKVGKEHVHLEPFPYLLIEDAISPELAAELLKSYPPLEKIAGGRDLGNNLRFSYSAHKSLKDEAVAPIWKEFVKTHTSKEFFGELTSLLGEGIRKTFPDLEDRYGTLDQWKVGIRKENSFEDSEILVDAQICVNTPVKEKASSVRGPHVDNPEEFYGGLLYLRHPDDDSKGGDLQAYRWKTKPKIQGKQWAHPSEVEHVADIPYRSGTLIIFVNSPYALHGVTRREPTDFPRYFVNFRGEIEDAVYDPKKHQERFFDKLRRKLG